MRNTREYERALRPLLAQAGGYARALLRNRQDAEDAVQQAALRGWERIASYDGARPFKGWWFAILRNCCIDMLRRARRFEPLEGHDPPAPEADSDADNDTEWARLDDAIAAVSDAHAEILRLRYFGDLSYAEIAEALSIPHGTVMSRLHLARKALAAKMEEHEP